MKTLFFKTVRNNYTSVWAAGPFKKTYNIGQRYQFDRNHPAHVFLVNHEGSRLVPTDFYNASPRKAELWKQEAAFPAELLNTVYFLRAEVSGSRVLICFGEVELVAVPVMGVRSEVWDFGYDRFQEPRFVSCDFVVIGEIHPKRRDMDFSLTSETQRAKTKVVNVEAAAVTYFNK
jgi:hypothetical protein